MASAWTSGMDDVATLVGQHVVSPRDEPISFDLSYGLAARKESTCCWNRDPVVVRDNCSLRILVRPIKVHGRRWPMVVGSHWDLRRHMGCMGMVCEYIWSQQDRFVEGNA